MGGRCVKFVAIRKCPSLIINKRDPSKLPNAFLRVLRAPFVIFVTTIYAGENFRRSKLFFRLRPLPLALEP